MYTSYIHKLIQTHLDDLEIEEQREQVSQLWELLKTRRTNSTNTHARKRSRNIPRPKIQRNTDLNKTIQQHKNETPDKQFLSLEQNVQRNRQIKEVKARYL